MGRFLRDPPYPSLSSLVITLPLSAHVKINKCSDYLTVVRLSSFGRSSRVGLSGDPALGAAVLTIVPVTGNKALDLIRPGCN